MTKIVCIPAYNEERVIGDLVKKSLKYADKVIVCNDCSTDNTALVAKKNGAEVISLKKNLGKGAAMKTLFRSAIENDPDVVVTIDGDGQFLPEEIPKLMNPILENKADLVIGYRFDSAKEMPSYRKIGNKLLDKITSMASNLPFRDTQSGFRAYSKMALKLIDFSTDGFGADAEILVNMSSKGLRISEEKVTVIYNTGGRTSTQDPISHGSAVFLNTLKYVSVKKPLTFYGIPGIILIVIGSVFGYVFLHAYLHNQGVYMASLGAAVILILFGTVLCATAVILFAMATLVRGRQ